MSRGPVRHIFICGAKSIGQYGGFETFVGKLAEEMQGCENMKLHIACKANGNGCMNETALPGAVRRSDTEFEYCGAHCFKLSVPPIGPETALLYDLKAIRYCFAYCRKHGITQPVLYLLACRVGPWMGWIKRRVHNLGGRLYVNPDGHEWLRGKWPWAVKRYWKLSERLTVKQADLLICDSRSIETYILEAYKAYRPQTIHIAYGADEARSPLANDAPAFAAWLHRWDLTPGRYCLAVGRFVPENNYETMIREWMRCETKKDLVLITNITPKQLRKLADRLPFEQDRRIKFAGAIYDQPLLKKIRENAFASIHGHEVGGTNPSLLEAMASTGLNLLLDVKFNREVGQDSVLYWNKREGSLAALLEKADQMTEEERLLFANSSRERIKMFYTWPLIAEQYAHIFSK